MKRQTHAHLRCSKKPIAGRFFAAILLTAMAGPAAWAEDSEAPVGLTEAQAVSRALERTAVTAVIEGEVAIERGQARDARAYANPTLAYSREQTFGSLGTGEDYLTLGQTIDLANSRGLRGDAADLRAEAAGHLGDVSRLAIATEARLRFCQAQYYHARVIVFERWQRHISDALANIIRREQRGIAAVYDRRRLERELMVATAQFETARAASERADARLAALIGVPPGAPRLPISGPLLPVDDPPALPILTVTSLGRPDLAALDLQLKATSLEQEEAARWWLPELTVDGGWKGIGFVGGARSDGFVVGASLAIPLWDQSTGMAEIARGRARALAGRRDLLAAELAGELAGARAEAVRLRQAATEFQRGASAASDDLIRIATMAYDGGEMELLALLDAYRGHIDDQNAILDLEHAARRARIEVDRLAGIGIQ